MEKKPRLESRKKKDKKRSTFQLESVHYGKAEIGRESIESGAAIFSEILLCDNSVFLALYTRVSEK